MTACPDRLVPPERNVSGTPCAALAREQRGHLVGVARRDDGLRHEQVVRGVVGIGVAGRWPGFSPGRDRPRLRGVRQVAVLSSGNHPAEYGGGLQEDQDGDEGQQSEAPPDQFAEQCPFGRRVPTAAAATARFCGESILPSTPAEELAAAIRTGSSPVCCGRGGLHQAEQRVGRGVGTGQATPIQPITGERKAKKPPVEASADPRVTVCPDRFITKARARTQSTVTMVHRSCTSVSR